MSILSRFAKDSRASMLKPIAGSAAIIAFASLAVTQMLDKATREGGLPHISIIASPGDDALRMASMPRPTGAGLSSSTGYDETPVASIGGRPMPHIVLDPCNGVQR
jgi:hypothetical protein